MNSLFRTALALALIVSPMTTFAADFTWETQRDRDGITVATSPVEGSKFKAVRGQMTVDATLSELVALVQDMKACPEWADLCKEASVIESLSPVEMYVHTYNDLPWPVSDRDAVAHILWSQDPESGAVSMRATIDPDKVPSRRGVVRVAAGTTAWVFTPTADGRVSVETFAHLDPSGAVPAWMTNRLLVDSPFKTLRAMREMVESGRYENAELAFVTER